MNDTSQTYRQKNQCFSIIAACVFFTLFLTSFISRAQTYALPDTSLRNKLLSSYPSVMTGNFLNTTAAAALTGTLNLSNADISNADGIHYFTNINTLDLSFNKLVTLPDISGMTQLTALYLMNNQLLSVPPISALTNLIDFQVQDNKLTSLPAFNSNLNLISIYCQNNKLTTLPDFSMLVNLEIFDIGNNKLMQLADLSPLINLKQLHVHQTGIDTIIGLSALTNLDVLFAWGNQIRDLSGLNSNTVLQVFQVFDNDLKSLPDLSNKPSLSYVSFINNYLSFEDILPLTSLATFSSFDYSPQKQLSLSSYTVREKDTFTWETGVDTGLSTNQYVWYKNGNSITTNSSGSYSIPSVTYSDSGSYHIVITNPGLPGLTLQTSIGTLSVKPCLEINSFNTTILSESCTDGAEIELTSINQSGGVAPFNYGIVATGKTDTLVSSIPQFQSLPAGVYSVVIKDSRMCQAMKNTVVGPFKGCNPVFSPNGDGIMDTYLIEGSGRVRIYDLGRNLIKELNAPAVWDGTKSDGSIAEDGYYAIVVNEKKIIHVTLIR